MKKIILIYLFIFCINLPVHALTLSADSACLIAADTGEIIFAKNENQQRPMASTTKIMTALLAAENGNMEDVVTVSKNAERQEGSSIYLRSSEKITLNDLVYGLMLNSGNDAAVAIAEHLSENVSDFAEQMTKKAVEIGAVNTQFKNPNGLDEPGHYTTAYDLALIAAYAMKNENFYRIVSTRSATGTLQSGQTLYFTNHNKLLNMYDGAVGVKTGFTKASGRCLVSAAERDGILLVAVTLNAPDDWNDHKKMLDYGFENAYLKNIIKKNQVLKTKHANGKEYNFIAADDVNAASCAKTKFEVKLHFPEKIPAPINKGEKAGFGEIFYKGKYVKQFDIVSQEDIPGQMLFNNKSFTKSLIRVLNAVF